MQTVCEMTLIELLTWIRVCVCVIMWYSAGHKLTCLSYHCKALRLIVTYCNETIGAELWFAKKKKKSIETTSAAAPLTVLEVKICIVQCILLLFCMCITLKYKCPMVHIPFIRKYDSEICRNLWKHSTVYHGGCVCVCVFRQHWDQEMQTHRQTDPVHICFINYCH